MRMILSSQVPRGFNPAVLDGSVTAEEGVFRRFQPVRMDDSRVTDCA